MHRKMMGTDTGFDRRPVYGPISKEVPPLATVEEAIKEAGLDYTVSLHPLRTESGLDVPMSQAVIRNDTQEALGVVGNRYHPLQNELAASVLENVIGKDKAVFEAGGTLRSGAVAFLVLKLTKDIVLPGDDVIERRFLFYTTHDGTGMTRVQSLPFRMFCANQLNVALAKGKKAGNSLALRHTPSIEWRLKDAEKILKFEENFYSRFEEMARRMLAVKFSMKQMKEFAEQVFPTQEGKAPSPQTMRARDQIIELYEEGQGQKGNRHALGTVWAAFNSVTEYVDHYRGTRVADSDLRDERKTESVWFGSGAALKQKALDLLVPVL